MLVKKNNGKIYGAILSNNERKAMNMEIRRQLAHKLDEVDATVLWILHEEFGFGEKRLQRFYARFFREMNQLVLNSENPDMMAVCAEKLLKYGIDISNWEHLKG